MIKDNLKILIADDKAIMRDLLKHTLRSLGDFEFIDANNGVEALRQYNIHKPDIVFLDINMPPSDGISALIKIKEKHNNAFIAMVSAESSITNVKLSLNAGADGFVHKPYNGKNIIDILNKYSKHIDKKS